MKTDVLVLGFHFNNDARRQSYTCWSSVKNILPLPQGLLWTIGVWDELQGPPKSTLSLLPVLFHCHRLVGPSLRVPEKNKGYLGIMPADCTLHAGNATLHFSGNARSPTSGHKRNQESRVKETL